MSAIGAGIQERNYMPPTSIDQKTVKALIALMGNGNSALPCPGKMADEREKHPNGSNEVDEWMMLAKRRWMR